MDSPPVEVVKLDTLPVELVKKVFELLPYPDISALRQSRKRLAKIGAEHLADQVRFHLSDDSITRLRDLSQHPIRNAVRTLVFEAQTLESFPCVHTFVEHFATYEAIDSPPMDPGPQATQRAQRLFNRSQEKWEKEVMRKYVDYRQLFCDQRTISLAPKYHTMIEEAIAGFANLKHLEIYVRRFHTRLLSQRFRQDTFGSLPGPVLPLSANSECTITHFQNLLCPQGSPLSGLASFTSDLATPRIFTDEILQPALPLVFQTLTKLDLTFQLQREDYPDNHGDPQAPVYKELLEPHLHDALGLATALKSLKIDFCGVCWEKSVMSLRAILGDGVWENLRKLEVGSFFSDEDYLVTALARQPALKELHFENVTLTQGTWMSATMVMREVLHLTDFFVEGQLRDDENTFEADWISIEIYEDDFEEQSLQEAFYIYMNIKCDSPPYHPLDMEFADVEEVYETHGFPDESHDDNSHLSDDDDTDLSPIVFSSLWPYSPAHRHQDTEMGDSDEEGAGEEEDMPGLSSDEDMLGPSSELSDTDIKMESN